MRLISWNMHQKAAAWWVLADLAAQHDAAVALLQEAVPPPTETVADVEPPADVPSRWHSPVPPVGGRGYASAVALLDRSLELTGRPAVPLTMARHGQDELVATHPGQFAVADVACPDGGSITVISLYGLWERMDSTAWIFAEATLHRAISDLAALLQHPDATSVVIAGDFNIWRDYPAQVGDGWQARYDSVFDRLFVYGLEVIGPRPLQRRGPLPGQTSRLTRARNRPLAGQSRRRRRPPSAGRLITRRACQRRLIPSTAGPGGLRLGERDAGE